MITQLEFDHLIAALEPPPPFQRVPIRKAEDIGAFDYALGLAASLRTHNVPPPAFNLMVSFARQQHARGWASVPQTATDLRCTYNAVRYQIKEHPELWTITADQAFGPGNFSYRITLTQEALQLLASIQRRAKAFAKANRVIQT